MRKKSRKGKATLKSMEDGKYLKGQGNLAKEILRRRRYQSQFSCIDDIHEEEDGEVRNCKKSRDQPLMGALTALASHRPGEYDKSTNVVESSSH